MLYANDTFQYKDDYGIPFGKYKLSTTSEVFNPNYINALSKNLVLKIAG